MTTQNKQQYRIRNCAHYNSALVRRRSLTLWIDAHALDAWLNVELPARPGRPRTYTDVAILCSLLLREVYHLPLRATQRLVCSVLGLLEVKLPAPDYSTLWRRARTLQLSLCAQNRKQVKHLVIDSTALKLYGEGQWRVRQHAWARPRTWRKLHLAMDADSHEVTAALITNKDVVDLRSLPRLLKQVKVAVERVYADGAYDSRDCYKALYLRRARGVIAPRKGSAVWEDEYLRDWNTNLRQVQKPGTRGWKRKAKYHRRSLVECAIFASRLSLRIACEHEKLEGSEQK